MALVKSMTVVDWLFLVSLTALLGSALVRARGLDRASRQSATVGWMLFTLFWLSEVATYLPQQRGFLSAVSGLTALLCVYTASLSYRETGPHAQLTAAFAIMGLLFVPYQFVLPLYHATLRMVTDHTIWGLAILGYDPAVEVGVTGQPTALRFESAPYLRYNIVSACTGISAITLFVGVVGVADCRRRRRVVVGVLTGGLIYWLNVLRTVIVGGAIAGQWFAGAAPVVTPLFGASRPALVSFYFAEYLLIQTLVVVVLVGVYVALSRAVPGIAAPVDELLATVAADRRALTSRLSETVGQR